MKRNPKPTRRDPNNEVDRAWMLANLDKLHADDKTALLWSMVASIEAKLDARLAATATPPSTEPRLPLRLSVTPASSMPTNAMRQRLAAFDDMSDADQVDALKAAGW